MAPIASLAVSILYCALCLGSAAAQLPLSGDEERAVAPVLASSSPNTLKCWLERGGPGLDFALRFVADYVTNCQLRQFEGKKTVLVTFVRVTPEGKPPVLFQSVSRIPEISPEMMVAIGGNIRNLRNDVSLSGAFALGEGKYLFELRLEDEQKHTFRKHWTMRVAAHRSQREVALSIKPLTVESIEQTSWPAVSSKRGGNLRLTILVDAAPMNPYQSRLRGWDRAFLLQTIYSVLRETPHKSVRLVAFNLVQQRELFRSDQFDLAAFQELARALKQTELSSISVAALKKLDSPEFLVALANQELAPGRSDAIIFLGANNRMDAKITAGALSEKKAESPPFFYFEYYPWVGAELPDSIDWLVKAVGGKVFLVHSPTQFDDSIDKMLTQLKKQ